MGEPPPPRSPAFSGRFDSVVSIADPCSVVISRRFSFWQKVAALAPLLFVAVVLPAEMMLRCQLDGLLRPACCCPATSDAPQTGPAMQAGDCCDPERSQMDRPIVEAARPDEADGSAALTVVAAVAPAPLPYLLPAPRPEPTAQRYGPARERPPIVIAKHAFLI